MTAAPIKLKDNDISDQLSRSQMLGIQAVLSGCPLVICQGGAGSGKSAFLYALRKRLETLDKSVAVAAPTGIAALNVEGETIHRLFRFPTHVIDVRNGFSPKIIEELATIDVLILDEMSMIRADIMDAIDHALRAIRKDARPFGGVQVVLIGDVMQICPIVTREEAPHFRVLYRSAWFFDSNVMQYLAEQRQYSFVWFRETFRQPDEEFVNVLNAVRRGSDTDQVVRYLNHRCSSTPSDSHIVLTSYRGDAERINQVRLSDLSEKPRTYHGEFTGRFSKNENNLPSPSELTLKVGAQVMVTKNTDGLANGTLGMVTDMGPDHVAVQVADGARVVLGAETWHQYGVTSKGGSVEANSVGTYSQIPLTLGYAQTVHRAQGLTLPAVAIDLGRGAFAGGQAYVALSRVRSLADLAFVRPLQPSDIQISVEARDWLSAQIPYAG